MKFDWSKYFNAETLDNLLRIGIILVVGLLILTVITTIVKRNPHCLDEPEPLIVFKDFGNSGINILLGAWFEKANFLKVKNSLFMEIKSTFDAEGIEIPFPHLSIYTGEATKPFPIVEKEKN